MNHFQYTLKIQELHSLDTKKKRIAYVTNLLEDLSTLATPLGIKICLETVEALKPHRYARTGALLGGTHRMIKILAENYVSEDNYSMLTTLPALPTSVIGWELSIGYRNWQRTETLKYKGIK